MNIKVQWINDSLIYIFLPNEIRIEIMGNYGEGFGVSFFGKEITIEVNSEKQFQEFTIEL